MSLRDTIDGARREAEGNVADLPKKDKKAKGEDAAKAEAQAKAEASKMSYARKSGASAKPSRQAAASVRTVSKSDSTSAASAPKPKTPEAKQAAKEAKKEEKRRRREKEDLRTEGYDILLRRQPGYKQSDRIWWVLLGGGFAFAIVSLAATSLFPDNEVLNSGTFGIVILVISYACIIGAFVYDWVKRRPMRKEAERVVGSMTDKRVKTLIAQDRKERAAEEAQKEAAKAAKKAKKK